MRKRILSLCLITSFSMVTFAQTAVPNPNCDELKARVERAENRLKDWPNLARYSADNANLPVAARGEDRVVFMGDSITDSWKLTEYFPGHSFVNRGIGGQTTPQMLIRFRPDVVDLKPRAVVIFAGTNDIAGNTGIVTLEAIEANIESMAELAKANDIRVVIASVLPISDYNTNKDGQQIVRSTNRPLEKIIALNKWIEQYAKANGMVYLDYFSAVVDGKGYLRPDLADDGLHPNVNGYRILAPLVEKAIAAALAKKPKK